MDNEYEFYYPGVYDEQDTKILGEFQAELAQVNNKGKINIDDLISGKLEGTPGVGGHGRPSERKITLDDMTAYAKRYGANNPLFTDREYAKKTKWGAMAMPFATAEPGFMPAMPKAEGIGDYMVVSAHNDTMNYYQPVYEGNTLYTIIDEQHCIDITPSKGSYYRTFAMSGSGRIFNQKGELVAEGANILKESFRRHKDPAKRNKDGAHAWESPDWWSRPPHIYTDSDWEYLISLWKNERLRGTEVLYWDDVNIGDEPTPRAVGPIVAEEEMEIMFDLPDWSTNTKLNVLDPKTFSRMVKNKQGVYVLPEYLKKKPSSGGLPFMPDIKPPVTPEIANRDGRAVVQNAVAAKWAAGMLFNWMGDAGWLQRIGWDIMELPLGYPENVIPSIPKELRPALFDKYPYMDKVPYMRGCRAAWHALEGDAIISRAYVTDKYEKDGEYFVDLTWWCQTLDKYLVEEGFATVKLPKKN